METPSPSSFSLAQRQISRTIKANLQLLASGFGVRLYIAAKLHWHASRKPGCFTTTKREEKDTNR
jgi:hypothetical protein